MKTNWKSESWLRDVVTNSLNRCQLLKSIGLTANASNYATLNKYINLYQIDTSHFRVDTQTEAVRKIAASRRLDDDEVFVRNSTYPRGRIKQRIINQNLMPYECDGCGNTGEWLGKKLVLQLEHKNGDNTDHRLDNLCFLCPNCHTQTETYAGRNK